MAERRHVQEGGILYVTGLNFHLSHGAPAWMVVGPAGLRPALGSGWAIMRSFGQQKEAHFELPCVNVPSWPIVSFGDASAAPYPQLSMDL